MAAGLERDAVVGVVGAGTMGAGIAQVAATAGHRVLLYDTRPDAAGQARTSIAGYLDRAVDKARLQSGERDATLGRIETCETLEQLAPAALVIEAIIEDLEAKRALFARLEELVAETTILATNTSALSITTIAAGMRHPRRIAGMHFFNPAPLMGLVEVVTGLETASEIAERLCQVVRDWGKTPALARSTPGFIVNRVARGFYGEGLRALGERCAEPATIDAVMRESGGFRMGPFELMDLIGVDVNLAVSRSVYEAYHHDGRFRPSLIQEELVLAGRLGRKSGHGFYRYAGEAERPKPATARPAAAPRQVMLSGRLGPAHVLPELLHGAGIPLGKSSDRQNALVADGVIIALTDGRSATQRAAETGRPVVLFDLALDYAAARRIALAPADQCRAGELECAVGLFQALGREVSIIDDFPAMLVMRTVAALANEAADAVLHGVAEPGAIDAAMKAGVNYPLGPLEWADRIHPLYVLKVLDHLHETYREERYRASAWLRRRAYAARPL